MVFRWFLSNISWKTLKLLWITTHSGRATEFVRVTEFANLGQQLRMVFARTFQISPQGILQQITVGGVWWAQEALARPDIAKSYLFLCFPNTMAFRIMKLLQEIWRPYQPSETDLMGMVLESIDQLPLFCFLFFIFGVFGNLTSCQLLGDSSYWALPWLGGGARPWPRMCSGYSYLGMQE